MSERERERKERRERKDRREGKEEQGRGGGGEVGGVRERKIGTGRLGHSRHHSSITITAAQPVTDKPSHELILL